MAERGGKEWSPKGFPFQKVYNAFVASIEDCINRQKMLTKYQGPDEGFRQYVADIAWDPYTYKLIGENTGYIIAHIDLAADLELPLPASLVRHADSYTYIA